MGGHHVRDGLICKSSQDLCATGRPQRAFNKEVTCLGTHVSALIWRWTWLYHTGFKKVSYCLA